MTEYLYVRNWDKFQHYKDRCPPWIKLHYELLTSSDWVMLADDSKLLAVVCMMIASRNEGAVPAIPEYVQRVAYLDRKPNFKPLIDCGFLSKDASACKRMQADARPEKETEKRQRQRRERKTIKLSEVTAEHMTQWAKENQYPIAKLSSQIESCRDWYAAKGKKVVDGKAAVRNWLKKDLQFNPIAKQEKSNVQTF